MKNGAMSTQGVHGPREFCEGREAHGKVLDHAWYYPRPVCKFCNKFPEESPANPRQLAQWHIDYMEAAWARGDYAPFAVLSAPGP